MAKVKVKNCFAILVFALSLSGCATGKIDELERSLDEIRSTQAQQSLKIDEAETQLRKLSGKIEELQYSAMGKTAELERSLNQVRSRVPPPPGVPEELLNNDEERIAKSSGEAAESFRKALQMIRDGDFEGARNTFDAFVQANPQTAFSDNAYFWSGVASEKIGQYDRAIVSYSEVFQRFPAEDMVPAALFRLADVFQKIGSNNDAAVTLQKLVDDYPRSEYARDAKVKLAALRPASKPVPTKKTGRKFKLRLLHTPQACLSAEAAGSFNPPRVVGVTIGNFDAMHLGHQALFERLETSLMKEAGGQKNLIEKVLFTFFPHPRQVLSGLKRKDLMIRPDLWSLTSLREKWDTASSFGFNSVFVARFNRAFSELKPEAFVRKYLVDALKARVVIVGHDWGFGKGRAGDCELLAGFGERFGFKVEVVNPIEESGLRVSTTAIKEALQKGEVSLVEKYLARPFSLSAHVKHGDARGRQLGYATANIEFELQILPADGVYATEAICEGRTYQSVTNVGVRPTFGGGRRLVEVHLLDVSDINLYGKRLTVRFLERLRAEEKFSSIDELKSAIAGDIERGRTVFKKRSESKTPR